MPPEPRRHRIDPRDSGAVALETAVLSLFLIGLLFGIVESSLLFKDWLAASSASRAGARMGASEPRVSTFAQDSADQVTNAVLGLDAASLATMEVWVYKASTVTGWPSTGEPVGANCTDKCVKYTWDSATQKLANPVGTWIATSQNACGGDPNRDSLGVYVKYTHFAPVRFFFQNLVVRQPTVMWLEPTSATPCL